MADETPQTLAELLGFTEPENRKERGEKPATWKAAAVMTLTEAAKRYNAGNPWKVGDVVTPRVGYNKRAEGEPHVVIEVADPPHRVWEGQDPRTTDIGVRLDVRVINVSYYDKTEVITAFWMESWMLEKYEEPGA